MYLHEIYGTIVFSEGGLVRISGESLTGDADEVDVYIHEAFIYDLITGYPAWPDHVYEGMAVRCSYEQNLAHGLWLNCGEDDAAAFKAVVSDNIHYNGMDCVFLTTDGKYRITLTADTVVIDPYRGVIKTGDIRPGMEMFVWVDMVTASYPAEAYPDRVVLVNPAVRDYQYREYLYE
jgi:hypothetical protein